MLSNQSTSIKGPEIHSDVAALLTTFLLKGIEKEPRNATIDSYPCVANCPALQPPEINPEIKSCLDANALKQDNFLRKLQSQLAAGISALAIPLDEQYEITKQNATDESKQELEKGAIRQKYSRMFFTPYLCIVVIVFFRFWTVR